MPYANPHALVSTDWLAARLKAPEIRVIDVTKFLPTEKRDGKAEFAERHIPGAVYFDIDDIADPNTTLPHMIPGPELFAEKVGRLGIGNRHHVICYDVKGLASAARGWWMLRLFGHDKVAVLDGGLPKWLSEGRPIESGAARPQPATFAASFRPELVRTLEQMRANLTARNELVLDARSRGRFRGTEPEPRPGMRGGHIPGSASLPYTDILNPEEKTVLPADLLARKFEAAGVTSESPVVTTCGTGVTAAALALGLYLLGREDVAVYDGSWTEWGGRSDTPIET
ncbi:MAG: 3-mercaptopyruvate sulfurtransferase [Proteobacteria bacterium]|nr:3-mercaptopyruvate sulfurtransferase [Pseudomonadota bacterium]